MKVDIYTFTDLHLYLPPMKSEAITKNEDRVALTTGNERGKAKEHLADF